MTDADRATARDILMKCRALLAIGWTQGAQARDAAGERTDPYGDKAVAFCPMGAFRRVTGWTVKGDFHATPGPAMTEGKHLAILALKVCAERRGFRFPAISTMSEYPETTHADVLALVDEAGVWISELRGNR